MISANFLDGKMIPGEVIAIKMDLTLYGLHFSRPGYGVSHSVHMRNFERPGITLVGSDRHTPAAGTLGILAFGAGGLEVAMASYALS
jgi:aconitate hydratase